jgi:alpha-tubulin suppressor-like RCC1 family protein
VHKIYTCGSGKRGRLGRNELRGKEQDSFYPVMLQKGLPDAMLVSSVACGRSHTLLLATPMGGQTGVWSWGEGLAGQLGLNKRDYSNIPTRLTMTDFHSELRSVAAGGDSSGALAENGLLWTWGENGGGQLGLGDRKNRLIPTLVTGILSPAYMESLKPCGTAVSDEAVPETTVPLSASAADDTSEPDDLPSDCVGFKSVDFGMRFAAAVDMLGRFWSWGEGHGGVLGNNAENCQVSPTLVENVAWVNTNTQFDVVYCGELHAAMLSTTGQVWLWGVGGDGRLGLSSQEGQWEPTLHPTLPPAQNIACGSRHTCVVTVEGSVLAMGRGDNGRLGQGLSADSFVPIPPKFEAKASTVSKAVAGSSVSAFLHSNGMVSTCGEGLYGTNGQGSVMDVYVPTPMLVMMMRVGESLDHRIHPQKQTADHSTAEHSSRFVTDIAAGESHLVIVSLEDHKEAAWFHT